MLKGKYMYKYVLLSALVLSTLVSVKAEEQTQVSLKNNTAFSEDANLMASRYFVMGLVSGRLK
jgi:hypothetical protein